MKKRNSKKSRRGKRISTPISEIKRRGVLTPMQQLNMFETKTKGL